MQKKILFSLLALCIIFSACHSRQSTENPHPPNSTETVNIFPVTSFIKAQLKELDSMPVTPLQIITSAGKTDSTWLKREDIRKLAVPFLSPQIDSTNMQSLFSEKSFLDQTINAYTFSYDPKKQLPDSIDLVHWDIYMNPQTNKVERIYLVKEKDSMDNSVTKQLTWVVSKWFSIRTITQSHQNKPQVAEEKLIWNFDD